MKQIPKKATAIKEININEPNVEKTVFVEPKLSLDCEYVSGSSEMGTAWPTEFKSPRVSAKSLSTLGFLDFSGLVTTHGVPPATKGSRTHTCF